MNIFRRREEEPQTQTLTVPEVKENQNMLSVFQRLLQYLKEVNKEFQEFNEASKQVAAVESSLINVRKLAEESNAMFNTMKELITGINAEGDRLAAFIQQIIEKLDASGLTGAEEAEIKEMLQTAKNRLSEIGADPADPIPPVDGEEPSGGETFDPSARRK